MSRISSLSCFLCLVLVANTSHAQVTATVNSEGFVVLTGSNIDLIGVELMSEGGHLVPVPDDDPAPFGFLLKNESTHITYGSLTSVVLLDGELALSAGYNLTDNFDLVGQWGAQGAGNDGPIAFPNPPVAPDPLVPEPESLTLLLAGIAAVGLFRRRSYVGS